MLDSYSPIGLWAELTYGRNGGNCGIFFSLSSFGKLIEVVIVVKFLVCVSTVGRISVEDEECMTHSVQLYLNTFRRTLNTHFWGT